jgi:hypothetical protein
MKRILFLLALSAASLTAAPQPNPPTVKIVIVDYAPTPPKFITWQAFIRWLRFR